MTDSDFRVPSSNKHRVRVATFLDILNAFRDNDGTDIEIEFVPDFDGPSLCGVMKAAEDKGEDVEEARKKYEESCKQNPREHQPAIDGFFARIEKHFGTTTYETIGQARGTLHQSSNQLMIPDINRMTIREFNAAWDRDVSNTSHNSGEVQTQVSIPVENRTKPLTKIKAARFLGKEGDKSGATEWITKCIADGTITAEKLTRQSYVFDINQFPKDVHKVLKPTQGN